MVEVQPWFCYLSGEHDLLPKAEVIAILEAEACPMTILEDFRRVLRVNTDPFGARTLARRAGYTRQCCREIFKCEAKAECVLETARTSNFEKYIVSGETFRVQVDEVDRKGLIKAHHLEGEVGKIILDSVSGLKVDLVEAKRTFFGISVAGTFLLGVVVEEHTPRPSFRRPSLRPYFHPSAMKPKLSRCLVNLARAKLGDIVLDAFCGTGSLLIEAGMIGCNVIGADVNPRMVQGTIQNLNFLRIENYDILVADARHLPFRVFSCVVSDPPYGRGSSTYGAKAKVILEDFLKETFDVLPPRRHLCLAFPRYQGLMEMGESVGYVTVGRYFMREHKNLTREIAVFKKR